MGVGIIGLSWSGPLIKLADPTPVLAIAALRLVFASPVMLGYVVFRGDGDLARNSRREWATLFFAGVALAAHFVFWIAALQRTSVVTGVVLVTLQPIFVGFGAWFLFRERPTRLVMIASVVALVGVALLASDDLGDRGSIHGDVLALIGGIMASGYLVIGKGMRQRISTATYGASVYTIAAGILLFAVAVTRTPLTGHSTESYLAILAVAVFSQLIGHNAINWALGYLPAVVVAFAILGEPVGAAVIAATILDEIPTLLELAGAALVMVGVCLVLCHADSATVSEEDASKLIAVESPAKLEAG